MASLDLKKYGEDLIFAELRDTEVGCEKFHGDLATVRYTLMSRMHQRKLRVEELISNDPTLLKKILNHCEPVHMDRESILPIDSNYLPLKQ